MKKHSNWSIDEMLNMPPIDWEMFTMMLVNDLNKS